MLGSPEMRMAGLCRALMACISSGSSLNPKTSRFCVLGVDVPVADFRSLLDGLLRSGCRNLIGAETDLRNGDGIVELHVWDRWD